MVYWKHMVSYATFYRYTSYQTIAVQWENQKDTIFLSNTAYINYCYNTHI